MLESIARNEKSGKTIFETVFSFMLIFLFVGIFLMYASQVVRSAQEIALKCELSNLRLSLVLYKALNKIYPERLDELCIAKKYNVLIDRYDESGMLIDPFGNTYVYDPNTGKIRSTTKKYERW